MIADKGRDMQVKVVAHWLCRNCRKAGFPKADGMVQRAVTLVGRVMITVMKDDQLYSHIVEYVGQDFTSISS